MKLKRKSDINNLSDLEDALSTGREFKLLSVPKEFLVNFDEQLIGTISNKNEAAEMLIKSEFDNNRIRTFIDENLLNKNLTMFYRRVKTSLEENGVNTMYLAIGLLRWYESNVSEKARYAPLILIPIEIIRKSASQGYIIRAREEETQINVTLLELLKRGFGFNVSSLMELPRDENGVDIKTISELLGHSSPTITLNRYVHTNLQNKRKAMEALTSKRKY